MSRAEIMLDALVRDFQDDARLDRLPSPDEMRRRAATSARVGLALIDEGLLDEAEIALEFGGDLLAWAERYEETERLLS